MQKLKFVLIFLGFVFLHLGCGAGESSDHQASEPIVVPQEESLDASAEVPEPVEESAPEVIQLKGVNLLGQSLFGALGPGKDLSGEIEDDEQTRASILETYAAVFGKSEGLRFGDVYADSPSTAYFLALSILADGAARLCQEEMWLAGSDYQGNCKCDDSISASSLLSRAIPYIDFAEQTELVEEFSAHCESDYRNAVSSLIASISFARKTQ